MAVAPSPPANLRVRANLDSTVSTSEAVNHSSNLPGNAPPRAHLRQWDSSFSSETRCGPT
jgi:hypothetical protein